MNLKCALLLSCDPRHRANCSNLGLLVLRVGIGVCFMIHGWPKIAGGPEQWTQLGGAVGNFGIPGPTVFWGFMAAFAESQLKAMSRDDRQRVVEEIKVQLQESMTGSRRPM